MEDNEMKEYLAKIRRTIADSREMISQANLRIAETDRLLESQGLTREQVLKFNPSREQRLLVNEELKRRGLPPIEDDEEALSFEAATASLREQENSASSAQNDELSERRRKFDAFMRDYRL